MKTSIAKTTQDLVHFTNKLATDITYLYKKKVTLY